MTQEIEVVHLVQEGAYLVNSAYGVILSADGQRLPQGRAVVSDLQSLRRIVSPSKVLSGWVNAESGEKMTPQEYSAKRAELDGDEDENFPSLEAEYNYKKFLQQWQAVFEETPELLETVQTKIVEVRVRSGDDDILSLWNSQLVSGDSRLYTLTGVDAIMLREVRTICGRVGLELDVPSHSGLRFAKIGGSYAFDDSFEPAKRPFIGTLEQCKEEKKRILAKVRNRIAPYVAKVLDIAIDNVGDVILRLRSIDAHLIGVRSKNDTQASLSVARKALKELIDGLTAQASPTRSAQ